MKKQMKTMKKKIHDNINNMKNNNTNYKKKEKKNMTKTHEINNNVKTKKM